MYLLLRDGDEFLQREFSKSLKPGRVAFTRKVFRMPTTTMIRNTDERDEFKDYNEAFYQVDDIRNWPAKNKIPFPYTKMHHARLDWEESVYFRYGRSIWASAVRVFNMAVMSIEDAAIQRHQSTQNVLYHLLARHGDTRANETFVNEYARRFEERYSENTTHMFLDGKTELQQIGGSKSSVGTVDDIRLILSILAIALEYPLDLLSVGVTGDSGGEELFRKETALKRTVENIIEKENNFILKPLIDFELMLAGDPGKYRITTFATTFEDANKKSKRGLLEVQAGVKSTRSYHEENNAEISWAEEKKRIEEDTAWKKSMGIGANEFTRSSPASGEQGATAEPDNQQERKTPGRLGVDEKEVTQ
jgi:hypothetical protein